MKFVAQVKFNSKTHKKFIKLTKSKSWDGVLAIGSNYFTPVNNDIFECEEIHDMTVLQDNPDVSLIVFGLDPKRFIDPDCI